MSRIVLIRHGEPAVPFRGRLRANEIAAWIQSYNDSGIIKSQKPPLNAVAQAAQCEIVVCSHLKRSIESAEALEVSAIHCADELFRELELPFVEWRSIRLPLLVWTGLFRLLWLGGLSRNGESLQRSKERASAGALKLCELAKEHGSVLFVGHGFLNRYIATALLSKGWIGPKRPRAGHWDYSVYDGRTAR